MGQLESLRELSTAQPAHTHTHTHTHTYIYIYIYIKETKKKGKKEENMPCLFNLMGSPTSFEY
jgi:hypothetical protein